MALQLLLEMGIDQEKSQFYLKEADTARNESDQNGVGEPQRTAQEQTHDEDEQDTQEAKEAKKSLKRFFRR